MSLLPIPRNVKIQSKVPDTNIEFFSDGEIENMKTYIQSQFKNHNKRSSIHRRYFLLLVTLLRTGGRIDEVLQVKPRDFDLTNGIVKMITLKKRKESYRTIPLHQELKDSIMEYLLENRTDPRSEDLLFPMRRQSVDEYFKKMQKELGFRIHAHKFRHTFGVKCILSNVPLNVLQKWLGHSSIFTTSIYTEITGMDTKDFMRNMN